MRLHLTLLAWMIGANAAWAGPRDFIFCVPGGEGSEKEAQPYLDAFLRHVESALGWEAGVSRGRYVTSKKDCVAYVKQQKPGFGYVSVGFFAAHKKLAMTPLGSVLTPGQKAPVTRYALLVRSADVPQRPLKNGRLNLPKGTLLVSNHLEEVEFLSRVAFQGQVDIRDHFKCQPTRRALKGIQSVARGTAGATIVDADQLAHLSRLKLDTELGVLLKSQDLPGFPVVAFRASASADDTKSLRAFLPKMCDDAAGLKVCRTLRMERFVLAKPADYSSLVAD